MREVKFTETKGRMGEARAGGGRNGELRFKYLQISVWEDEKFLEMNSSDNCITLWMYLMPLNHTFENGKFCYVYFTTSKKIRLLKIMKIYFTIIYHVLDK